MPASKIPYSNEFKRLWLSGTPLADLAAMFGCTRATVSDAAYRRGLPKRSGGFLANGETPDARWTDNPRKRKPRRTA